MPPLWQPCPMQFTRILGAGALAGVALAGYAATEARAYTVREATLPLLPPGSPSVKVLHLTDLHLTPGQTRKRDWVRDLAGWRPDLVVNTGDNLAHRRAVPVVLEAFEPLLDLPGAFVFGSNDYFEPGLRNPIAYLLPDNGKRHVDVPQLPWRDLHHGLTSAGWLDLTNTRQRLTVRGVDFALTGVDDPHLGYDDLDAVAGPAPAEADVRLGVAHAPYLRVLDHYAATGHDLILAGHTHGGQVCLPFIGALTTNCDLEPARAKGLHRHPPHSRDGDPDSTWMHVSAGLGSNPYLRFRVACRPEATLLTLTARG